MQSVDMAFLSLQQLHQLNLNVFVPYIFSHIQNLGGMINMFLLWWH